MNFSEFGDTVRANVAQVIIGKDHVVDLMLVALLCDGHVLLEDVPGIGKTTLAKALARSLDCSFARIQFTPDLLPSDVTGINFFNQRAQEFEFRPGPVFSQILLADEINRATPRTQSSLLEAMQEHQITLDGTTTRLSRPFLVIATQNPIELEGTFPLPEAQLDRFLLQLSLGYPSMEEEEEILLRYRREDPLDELKPVADAATIRALQTDVRDIRVSEPVRRYILDVVRGTREHESVELGVSPRGSLALYRAGQALAALHGRDYVIPSDVQHLCPALLTHRIHISPQTRLRGRTPSQVVEEIAERTPVPVAE
ncbi:MAG: MoxR family ATPase [Caldilineaceae bacterium]|nr:MoxR family ATPase [Caldilineaceae bacterium]MCB9137596.1 MoxR family ATPase [Caldilineaceae bacterium]